MKVQWIKYYFFNVHFWISLRESMFLHLLSTSVLFLSHHFLFHPFWRFSCPFSFTLPDVYIFELSKCSPSSTWLFICLMYSSMSGRLLFFYFWVVFQDNVTLLFPAVVSYFTAVSGNSSTGGMILVLLSDKRSHGGGCQTVYPWRMTLDYYQVKQYGGFHKLPAVQKVNCVRQWRNM